MKVVFLDRFAIRAALRPLRFAHEWTEYPTTTPEQVIERLAGADIAITNRVRFDADIIARLPALKLIAVSATGYETFHLEMAADGPHDHEIVLGRSRGRRRHE